MAPSLETQKKTIEAFLASEEAWDMDFNVELRTTDCLHQIWPASFGGPAKNNTEFREFYDTYRSVWKDNKFDVHQVFHDGAAHKSLVHITNTASTPAGPFQMESMFIVAFIDDGSKIKKVEEVFDSAYLADFLPRLAAAVHATKPWSSPRHQFVECSIRKPKGIAGSQGYQMREHGSNTRFDLHALHILPTFAIPS